MTISAYAMVLAVHYILKCSDKDWKGQYTHSSKLCLLELRLLIEIQFVKI